MVHLRIGCRASRLAQMQTQAAGEYIAARSDATFSLAPHRTAGDKITGSLKAFGGKGGFVKDVEKALLDREIDLAIHCLKDMPGNEVDNPALLIAGYLPRADAADVLISRHGVDVGDLPLGARIGTSSPRRAAQLKMLRADLVILEDFRGAIETRANKALNGDVDATLLAMAGLRRIGDTRFDRGRLDPASFLPAIGQGTLVLQCRAADKDIFAICAAADDAATQYASHAERACLRMLDGDCFSAIAGFCAKVNGVWTFDAAVFSVDGAECVRRRLEAEPDDGAEAFGRRMATALLAGGAGALLEKAGGSLKEAPTGAKT